jgi:threonine dehydrogenase-like Zn-dependent dehydrogenase
VAGLLPDAVAAPFMKTAGVDRMAALHPAFEIVRRGGTVSLSGVYGGMADPMPMLKIFDKQIQLRMGQANVLRWVTDILPLLTDGDPPGVDGFATHRLPLQAGARGVRQVPAEARRHDQGAAATRHGGLMLRSVVW